MKLRTRPGAPKRVGPHPILLIASVIAVVMVATPLVFLFSEAIVAPTERMLAALARPQTKTAAINTVLLTVSAILGSLLVGVPTAFALVRMDLPLRKLWWVLAALPLAVPSYVAGLAWSVMIPLRGFWGSLFVLVLVTSPYVTLPTAAALRRADTRAEDVARTLGRGPVQAFFTMTMPQIAPAAASGALLVGLYTISEFGVVAIMRFRTLTPSIERAFGGSFNRELAMLLSVLLVAMALVVIAVERAVRRPVMVQKSGHGRASSTVRTGRVPTMMMLAGMAVCAVGVPVGLLLWRSTQGIAGGGVEWARLLGAAKTTVFLGFAGALVAIVVALPVAILAARWRTRSAVILETAVYVGHGLPGIVLGLSMVYMSLKVVPSLYQTLTLMVLAYGLLFAPKSLGSARSALEQVPLSLEDASRTLGRSPIQTWLTVTGRIAWPGIAAGALLVALTVMKELPATLMLRPTGTDTLATRLWQLTDIVAFSDAAPYGVALVLVAAVPALVLARDSSGSLDADTSDRGEK